MQSLVRNKTPSVYSRYLVATVLLHSTAFTNRNYRYGAPAAVYATGVVPPPQACKLHV